MADANLSVSVETKDARQELSSLTAELKKMKSETELSKASLGKGATMSDKLRVASTGLTKQLGKQREITTNLKKQMDVATTTVDKSKKKWEQNRAALDQAAKSGTASNEEIKRLTDNCNKSEAALKRNETALTRLGTQMDRAQKDELNLSSALQQTNEKLALHSGIFARQSEKIDNWKSKYNEGKQAVSGLTDTLTSAGRVMTVGVTLPLSAAAAMVVKTSKTFNEALANIGTLGVDTTRIQELKAGIQEIAVSVGKDTTDIANGVYQVVSAYGDSADTLKMVEINAKAASAGMSTTTDAINLTSAVTKGYGDVNASATQKASDLAFETVKLGQTDFPQLAASMGKVVPSANAMKVSQEELFGVFATLTGVTGTASEVSTQFGAVLKTLMKPSAEMQGALKKMGFESGFAAIESLGLQGTLQGLANVTGGSEEALVKLAGEKEAVTAMLALTGAQADTFADKLGKLQNAAGATDRAFEAQS